MSNMNEFEAIDDVIAPVLGREPHDGVCNSLEMARQACAAGSHDSIAITCELVEDNVRRNELDPIRLDHGEHCVEQRQVAKILGQIKPGAGGNEQA